MRQKLAEICHNGYMDALCFLREKGEIFPPSFSLAFLVYTIKLHYRKTCYQPTVSDLLTAQNIHSSAVVGAKSPCCEQTKEVGRAEERMMKCHKENHLDHRVIENLPVAIKKGKVVK